MVKDPVTVSSGVISTYSIIADLPTTYDHQSQPIGSSTEVMKESTLAGSGDVDGTYMESGIIR